MTPRCTHIPTGLPAKRAPAAAAAVPVLRTDRLRLRAAPPAWNALLVPDIAGHLGGPHSDEDARSSFCVCVARWALHGHGLRAVDHGDTGAITGFVEVGLERGDANPEPDWMFRPDPRRQGSANEAARAAHDRAFGEGGLKTLVSYVHTDNSASAALAQRPGTRPLTFTHHREALQ